MKCKYVCSRICSSFYLPLSICMSVRLCLTECLLVCLSVCLPACPSSCLSTYLSACLSVLSIGLPVCLSVRLCARSRSLSVHGGLHDQCETRTQPIVVNPPSTEAGRVCANSWHLLRRTPYPVGRWNRAEVSTWCIQNTTYLVYLKALAWRFFFGKEMGLAFCSFSPLTNKIPKRFYDITRMQPSTSKRHSCLIATALLMKQIIIPKASSNIAA